MDKDKRKKLHFETLQLHAGQEKPDPATDARAVPIYMTSSYVFADAKQAAGRFGLTEGGNIYTRLMNPTTEVFEERIAALEGGIGALATASGAAAITYAIQNIAGAGDHVIASNRIYGGTYNLLAYTLQDLGIQTTFVDPEEIETLQNSFTEKTKLVFMESLGNPSSNVADIDRIALIAHEAGVPLIVDNTFATPYLLRPIEHGADIVVHSATKFIGGHGTAIGGIIVDAGQFDWSANNRFPSLSEPNASYHGVCFTKDCGTAAYITKARVTLMRDMGATLSPFHSFLFLQGLETLSLRVERHVENTKHIVAYLKDHPQVERVNHPSLATGKQKELYDTYFPKGAGSIFTFEIKGGAAEAKAFIDQLELFSLLANVADVKSLVIHPASTTHAQMSAEEQLAAEIRTNTIRLSIGTEHVEDLLADLDQAFKKISNE